MDGPLVYTRHGGLNRLVSLVLTFENDFEHVIQLFGIIDRGTRLFRFFLLHLFLFHFLLFTLFFKV